MDEASESRAASPEGGTGRAILRRDVVIGALVALAWLVPVAQGAVYGRPSGKLPFFWKDLCTVSCLFPVASRRIVHYHLEVQRAGRPGFEPLDESALFRMPPFGNRTRFDYFMARSGAHSSISRRDLVAWLAARDRVIAPDRPPIVRVRFLQTVLPITEDRPPQGAYRKPPRPDRAGPRPRVLDTHRVAGRRR